MDPWYAQGSLAVQQTLQDSVQQRQQQGQQGQGQGGEVGVHVRGAASTQGSRAGLGQELGVSGEGLAANEGCRSGQEQELYTSEEESTIIEGCGGLHAALVEALEERERMQCSGLPFEAGPKRASAGEGVPKTLCHRRMDAQICWAVRAARRPVPGIRILC